jgi:hypothetical protein
LFLVILSLFLALSGCVLGGGVLVAMICWAIYLNCDKKYPWTQNSFGTFFLGFLSSILPWFDITERLKGKTELYEILYSLIILTWTSIKFAINCGYQVSTWIF